MNNRRTFPVIVLLALFAVLAFCVAAPVKTLRVECTVYSDKTVINYYDKDKLRRSLSISSDRKKMREWRRPMKTAQYVSIKRYGKDYHPSDVPEHKRLIIYVNDGPVVWRDDVTDACYASL